MVSAININVHELLLTKQIYEILDGDIDFGEYELSTGRIVKLGLPYLSGTDLCGICTQFGLPKSYSWQGSNQSRWSYVEDLLLYCIERDKLSLFFNFLFSKKQFMDVLRGFSASEINEAHDAIIKAVLGGINGLLYFGGNELCSTGSNFYIRAIDNTVVVEMPELKVIDHIYISEMTQRALKDIEEKNYDSAITKSRTLIEEVFCYVIEAKGEVPTDSGNIKNLYNQVKGLYNMHQSAENDKRVNGLLSGLEKILTAITEMRNEGSDAHGVGSRRINIEEHHARLLVNSSLTMADFILSVSKRQL